MKETKKIFTPEYMEARNRAAIKASSFKNREVSSVHFFLGVLSLLNEKINKDHDEEFTEKYGKFYNSLKTILNKNGINVKNLVLTFTQIYKAEPSLRDGELSVSADFSQIEGNLQRKAFAEKRSMDLIDLMIELISDRSYIIYGIFEQVIFDNLQNDGKITSQSEEIVTKMVFEIYEAIKPFTAKEIKELEGIQELTNINKLVLRTKPVPINIEKTLKQMILGLGLKSIPNICMVGPAGVGKTFSIYALADAINKENVPDFLKGKVIYEADMGALIAGTKYRGEFEMKIKNILESLKNNPDAILFIDEAQVMSKIGDNADGGANSAANLFKPYLTKGINSFIWATTDEEYGKFLEPDRALSSRFNIVRIPEPSTEETKKILLGLVPSYETFYKKKISNELLDSVLEISTKYNISDANPRKSIKIFELACAYGKIFNKKDELIMSEDVKEAINLQFGIKITDKKAGDTKDELNKVLLGQNRAIKEVSRDLEYIEKGLVDKNKPLLSMILAGPTGVGKTETANIISEKFCGLESAIKINGGEYGSEMDVSKLLGSAPGYVGSDKQAELVSKVKQYPFSVVLIDEVEKMNPKAFDVFLNILDTGIMVDNQKNKVSFRNCIIIFTTNIGYSKDFAQKTGFGFVKTETTSKDIKDSVEKHFKPEFINRIDDIIVFDGLTKDIAKELIERYLKEYSEEIKINIKLSNADIEEIIKASEIEAYGARGLRRAVKAQIAKVLDKQKEIILLDEEEKMLA